ncbi:MAG: phytoene desaturase family protein [Saprospiraceae bacterium]|nr:phytoene desaturase family protein [Saprospiraceae bacterium]
MKKVVVIGSGFSGLAAACCLAAEGFEVTILEKNNCPGGRARQFEAEGFVFDMGPSWYWMPDVFEDFFALFGKKVSDYYELVRLDPSYQVFFGPNDRVEIPAQMAELENLFEQIEPGSVPNLRKFLTEAEYKYRVGMGEFVHKPSHSIWEFADLRVLSSMIRLQMFTPMSRHVRQLFKSEKLIQLLEFPVLFLGATPQNTPALYSLMNYADMSLGTWYPMGGMFKIVEAMVSLARELSVEIKLNQEIGQIETANGKAISAITADGTRYAADAFVGSADYHHIETKLLDPAHQNYSESYWKKRVMAPSSLLWYIGVNKRVKGLHHHNLFFDEDFGLHSEEIYTTPKWPSKPLFYASAPSVTDPSVAPPGCENLFLLIPVAPGLEDTPEIRARYFDVVMERLERHTGQSIRPHIVYQRSYAHADFVQDYHAFRGNAYGLANTLLQTAFLKPKMKNRHLSNLWYTGQLTTPGPGVPPSLISGQVVAKEVQKVISSSGSGSSSGQ